MALGVHIDVKEPVNAIYHYIWNIFARYKNIDYAFTTKENAKLVIEIEGTGDISSNFITQYETGQYAYQQLFDKTPLIFCKNGTPDYLSTAFYMINSLQEYAGTDLDNIGRFKYKNSFQYQYSCVK